MVADQRGLENLNSALKDMEECARRGDVAGYQEATFLFALYSCRGAGNPLLEEVVLFLWPDVRRLQYAALSFQKNTLLDNLKYYQTARGCF
ncbi:MAG: FCD domain-containing protein [Actinomycetota bacterium]